MVPTATIAAITAEMGGVTALLQGIGALSAATVLVANLFPAIITPILEGLGTLFYWCSKDELTNYLYDKKANSELGLIKHNLVERIMKKAQEGFNGTVQLTIEESKQVESGLLEINEGLKDHLTETLKVSELAGSYTVKVAFRSNTGNVHAFKFKRIATLFSISTPEYTLSSPSNAVLMTRGKAVKMTRDKVVDWEAFYKTDLLQGLKSKESSRDFINVRQWA